MECMHPTKEQDEIMEMAWPAESIESLPGCYLDDLWCSPLDTLVPPGLDVDMKMDLLDIMSETPSCSSLSSTSEDEKPRERATVRSPRVRTYTARKQEIKELLHDLPQLENYVEFLKQRAAESMMHNDNSTQPTQRKRLVNLCLRDKVVEQHLWLARLQSAMNGFTAGQERMVPFDSQIYLSDDTHQRLQYLMKLKPYIIEDAKRYMRERSWFLDLSTMSKDQTSFTTQHGDECELTFSILPLDEATSVKYVFDMLNLYLSNVETMLENLNSKVLMRDEGLLQIHTVFSSLSGVQVESNHVIFSEYEPHNVPYGDGREYGIIAIAPVQRDALQPYHSTERLRHLITGALTIRTVRDKVMLANNREIERVNIVVTRMCFTKLHRCPANQMISDDHMRAIRDHIAQVGDTLFRAMKTAIVSQHTSRP